MKIRPRRPANFVTLDIQGGGEATTVPICSLDEDELEQYIQDSAELIRERYRLGREFRADTGGEAQE